MEMKLDIRDPTQEAEADQPPFLFFQYSRGIYRSLESIILLIPWPHASNMPLVRLLKVSVITSWECYCWTPSECVSVCRCMCV